ncbi:MAG: HesB/IscA family protein [Chloroflexota bacterium]
MISISDQAVTQLSGLMQQQGLDALGLRVFVAPGGCSGFQYGMRFEDSAIDGDTIEELQGIRVYVDEFSAEYLDGAEIDFVDELMGGGFTVHNPNAVTGCSCGQSFTAAQGGGAARPCGH